MQKEKRKPPDQFHSEPAPVINQYFTQAPLPPRSYDHSGSGSWIIAGFFFAIVAIPLALLWDISSPNSGGRTIATVKGFIGAILVSILLYLIAFILVIFL